MSRGSENKSTDEMLPPVLPVRISDVDDHGDLFCQPTEKRLVKQDGLPAIVIPAARAAKHKPTPGKGDRFLVRIVSADDDSAKASIIRKIGEDKAKLLAVLEVNRGGAVARPVDRKEKGIYRVNKADRKGAQDGDLVWITPSSGRQRGSEAAKIIEIAGNMEEPGAYSLIALAGYDIPIEFPDEVLDEAAEATLPTKRGREDLRELPLLTIDPHDAKDHDDAIAAWRDDDPKNEGGYRMVVAIADVSWFVRPGSALDREALKRGNSVYLPDRVVPMLPESLSNDLCSLREQEDRPCLAVEMTMDSNGRLRGHRFMRAMMRSEAKLSYEEAQAIIDGGAGPSAAVREAVREAHAAYKVRLKERAKRAPLDLELSERKILLGQHGLVDDVAVRDRFDAHRLIEEFMIMANVAAAEALEKARLPLIYRVHDTPDPEKLEQVRTYLQTLDYTLIKGGSVRPQHFNQVLKIASQRDEKEMVSDVILRTQKQAVYATENLGHFGLNLAKYAHFTSPIRRYADLTVHRALVKAFSLGAGGQTRAEGDRLESIAGDISNLERRAMMAERETVDRYLSDYLSDRVGAEFSARIRGVTRFGLFVMLDQTGADGFVPMRSLPGRNWRFDEEMNRVIDIRSQRYYQLGQPVQVCLQEAAPVEGGLVFELLSEPKQLKTRTGTNKGRKNAGPKAGIGKKAANRRQKPAKKRRKSK